MNIGENIKKLRENKGMFQKQVAAELGIGYTNYNKMENGIREPSVKELQLLSRLFGITIDQILNFEGDLPKEIKMEDQPGFEQINLINQLDEDDKTTILKIINTMLTKKKFKDFFQQQLTM